MILKNMTVEGLWELQEQLDKEKTRRMIKDGFIKPEELKFELVPLKDSIEKAKERIERPNALEGISSGYANLDEYLGGFAKEELIVVAGGTGQGKTQFVQSLILNMVLDDNPVLFFTLEMPPVETTVRFIHMIKSKYVEEVLPELPIYYYHGTNVNIPVLDEAIKKGIEIGIKCVVVDHIHFFAKKQRQPSGRNRKYRKRNQIISSKIRSTYNLNRPYQKDRLTFKNPFLRGH